MALGRPHTGGVAHCHSTEEEAAHHRVYRFVLRRCGARSDSMAGPDIIAVLPSKPRLTFGRGEVCDVRLSRAHVSKLHAKLEVQLLPLGCTRLLIEDTSSNGTWVNGERLSRKSIAEVRPGDRVSFLPAAHACYPDALMYEVLMLHDGSASKSHPGAEARTKSISSIASRIPRKDNPALEGTQHSPDIAGGRARCSISSNGSGQSLSKRKRIQEPESSRKLMAPTQHPASHLSKPDACSAEEPARCHVGRARALWRTEGFPWTCLSASHPAGSGDSQPDVAVLPASAGKHGRGQRGGCKGAHDEPRDVTDGSRGHTPAVTFVTSLASPALRKDSGLPAAVLTSSDGQRCRNASAPCQTSREDHGLSVAASAAYGGSATAILKTPRVGPGAHRSDGLQVVSSAAPGGPQAPLLRGAPSHSHRAWRKGATALGLRRAGCCKRRCNGDKIKRRCNNDKTTSMLHTTKPLPEAQAPKGVEKGGGGPGHVNSDASHLAKSSMEDRSRCGVKDEPVEAAAAGVQSKLMSDGAWFTQCGTPDARTAARDAAQTMRVVKSEPASPMRARPGPGAHSAPLETTGQRDVNAWLRSIDGGFLQAKYQQALLQLFDDVSQIATLYANRPEDFFEDVPVTDAAHKTSFRAAIGALCQQHGLATGTVLSGGRV
eukprot:NODE_2940_length_2118_cov_9.837770.p1 GENE.NODE_2940_length_2118_cov_9.837770~~NODE_2940_length_2118_cov_9.837770.p1  ORF type:complete len:659 (+),score=52.64 NODE_2940_length_2118_cov_9.837770:134-2110(+)